MREETIMASVVKHTADLMQENHKLKSDLTQAHEMIREFREALEFYGDKKNWHELVEGEHKICGTFKVVKYWTDCGYEYDIDGVADEGKRARAVLSKHAEFLKKIGGE